MKRAARALVITGLVSLTSCAGASDRHAPVVAEGSYAPAATSPSGSRLDAAYGRLPLHFEENRGQAAPDVRLVARTATGRIELAPGALRLGVDGSPVRLSFASATEVAPEPLEPLPARVNYYRGPDPRQWRTDIPTFARVRYPGVYPGIDVVVYGNQREFEYDFVVAPGADPATIRVRVEGAEAIAPTSSGDLTIRHRGGAIVQRAPVAYQQRGGRRERVAARYLVRAGGEVAFEIGAYDRTRPLVIDPVIAYSARIGLGSARGIAVDTAGYAYFTGVNAGVFNGEYPTVNAVFPQRTTGLDEIFVTKLSPDGASLIYSTYFGGAGRDAVTGIATDGAGNAFITGTTHGGVPTTPGAFQTTARAPEDGGASFVVKFGPTGALVYSTYLQGTTFDNMADPIRGGVCYQGSGNGIAADAAGNAYVVGFTSTNDFPTTPGAYIATKPTVGPRCNVYAGGYLTKLSPDGSSLVYSTYLDGNGAGLSVAVDGAGNAYVGGVSSPPSAPPGTVTASLSDGGTPAHYVTRFNPGGFPTQTTLIGFPPNAISVGSDSSIYVAGEASAGRMTASGTAWIWTTSVAARLNGIAAAPDGSAWVVGSGGAATPTKDALRSVTHPEEAVVLQFSPAGALLFGTPLGEGRARGVDVDPAGNAYVTGDAGVDFMPVTPGAYAGTHPAGQCPSGLTPPCEDVFVVKFGPGSAAGGGADTAAPTVSITRPANGAWTGNSLNFATTASDDVGLRDITLWGNGRIFGTIPCMGTTCSGDVWWSTGGLSPAAYEVNAVASDSAGNRTISATLTIFKDAKSPRVPSGAGGATPPPLAASITSPANGATVSGDILVAFGSVNVSGTPLYTLKVDNANVLFSGNASMSTVSTPWSTQFFSNGTHTLNLTVSDAAGRTAASAVTVTVSNSSPGGRGGDTSMPTVRITSPANGAWTGNSLGFGASASDDVALRDIKLWGNGTVFGTIPCSGTTCSGSVTWITGPLPPAAYEVNAVAADTSGNQTVSTTVTIYKDARSPRVSSGATAVSSPPPPGGGGGADTTPPSVTITSPPNDAWTGNSIRVVASASDDGLVATLRFYGNGTQFGQLTCGAATCRGEQWWTTGPLPDGKHTITVVATDAAGNQTTSAPIVINK